MAMKKISLVRKLRGVPQLFQTQR